MIRAIVFDFDGVILESADIKTEAFRDLFSSYPDMLDAIVRYHLDNVGISRFTKFRAIYRDFLDKELEPAEEARLGRQFAERVFARVLACPFVPGAKEFLAWSATQHAHYLASGTPEDELRDIVERRGLSRLFSGIHGSPRSKDAILQGIMSANNWSPPELVFIGDGLTDARAAAQCGVPFIGRVAVGAENIFHHEAKIAVVEDLRQLRDAWPRLFGTISKNGNL